MDSIPYLLGFAVLLATLGLLLFPGNGADYRRYETDTLRYVRGTVTQVLSQECSESALGTGQTLGVQHLEVSLSDGALVEIDNYLTETHNILARPASMWSFVWMLRRAWNLIIQSTTMIARRPLCAWCWYF